MPGPDIELSLDELAGEVAQLLADRGLLGAAPDGRVAAAPDPRTIRYYTTLGLLDRPRSAGRQARYGRRHLLQLLAIKALQAGGLPLAEVQARLYGLTDAELEALLAAAPAALPEAPAAPRLAAKVVREIAIEPGLVLSAEAGWSPSLPPEELERRLRAALAVLAGAEEPRRHAGQRPVGGIEP